MEKEAVKKSVMTDDEIKEEVRRILHMVSGFSVKEEHDNNALKKYPIMLDDNNLRELASLLGTYIKKIKPGSKISFQEISGGDFKVKDLYELVIKKVKA